MAKIKRKKRIKPTYNGITFDSKLELNHYRYLLAQRDIEIIELQPFFLLLEPFEYYDFQLDKKRKYGKFSYKADFLIKVKGVDKLIVFESKGFRRGEFMIRRKMWYNQYGKDYYYLELSSLKACETFFNELRRKHNEDEK